MSDDIEDHDHVNDPFAPRNGRHLVWKDVNMTLKTLHGMESEEKHFILQDVWGEVPPKQLTAIMGPSGSGKTSLLNVLAGRAQSSASVQVEADVRIDNYAVNPSDMGVRKLIAFVAQDDSLQVTATPREAIRFSAKLRLDRSITDTEVDQLVDHMLSVLGLTSAADTIIGGSLIKGISGGERKRTSVGVELVVRPTLVFLDEPTSGLDSFSAMQLCQVLRKVANAGASILFTIHQPASAVFNSFDQLLLLNMGRVMYQGPVSEVDAVFSERGFPVPSHYNPADFVMEIAQTKNAKELAAFFGGNPPPLDEAHELDDAARSDLGITVRNNKSGHNVPNYPGLLAQTKHLLARELINVRRNRKALRSRFGLTIVMSTLIGLIFLDVADEDLSDQSNLQSAFGGLILVSLIGIVAPALPSLLQFPEERPVFLREYSTNHYSVGSYFFSRLTMEAIVTAFQMLLSSVLTYFMIGYSANFALYFLSVYLLAMTSTALGVMAACSVENPSVALEFMPMIVVPQMIFAGFFVTPSLIPVWLRWLRYIFPLTYVIRILLVENFDDCSTDPQTGVNQCDALLDKVDADPDETWWYWLILVLLFTVFRLVALVNLRKKATKFY